jgi:hypothetical protein
MNYLLVPVSLGLTGFESRRFHITPLVDRFIAAKIAQGLAPKTVTNLLLDLQVILKQAVRWRLMRSNPGSGRRAATGRAA